MNSRRRTTGVAAALACTFTATLAWSATPGQPGVKRALLIGINQYQAVPTLQGSVNDVETMRELLVSRFGFLQQNVTTLLDQSATRAGILSALRQLVNDAGPDDSVYVHYSGHGSQVEDLNGDEPDGLDETIVPQDGRTPGVADIVDDELDVIFAQLKTRSVVIVLDSCHSGTATRSPDIRARGIPRDMRIDLYREAVPPTRAIVPRMESQYVVLSSAADDEEALDGPIDGRFHGFFTYALSRSIAAASPTASVRELFSGVARELSRLQAAFGRTAMPEPQLEGPPSAFDAPLFSAAEGGPPAQTGRVASLAVVRRSDREVLLVNGALLGAARGSTWSLYPPEETEFAAGRAIAVATATADAGKDTVAELNSGSRPVPPGARATLLMPVPAAKQIFVRVADVPAARRQEIETVLARTVPNVSVAGPGQSARFAVDADGDAIRLLSADGLQVLGTFDNRTDTWGPAVAKIVSRANTVSELLSFDNPASQIRLTARVAGRTGTYAPAAPRSIVLASNLKPVAFRIRRTGEARSADNSLQLELAVNTDAFVTVVDVDSEGNVNTLFPNPFMKTGFAPDGRVRGSLPLTIPDSLEPGNRAGFYWDYGPPAGLDTVRVFVSSDLGTANVIRQRIRDAQATSHQTRGLHSEGPFSSALDGLRRDLERGATRGISVVPDRATAVTASVPGAAGGGRPPANALGVGGDWCAATVSVVVRE